jgi:hypothetical protein
VPSALSSSSLFRFDLVQLMRDHANTWISVFNYSPALNREQQKSRVLLRSRKFAATDTRVHLGNNRIDIAHFCKSVTAQATAIPFKHACHAIQITDHS